MKNLKSLIIIGLIGAESLGFLEREYGQNENAEYFTEEFTLTKTALNVFDRNNDKKSDKYVCYFDSEKNNYSLIYEDEDFDGKMDLYEFKISQGNPSKTLEYVKRKINEDFENKNYHEDLILKFENYTVGAHNLCVRKKCNNQKIFNCLIDIF